MCEECQKRYEEYFTNENFKFSEGATMEQDIFYNFVDSRDDYNNMVEEILTVFSAADKLGKKYGFGSGSNLSSKIWGKAKGTLITLLSDLFGRGAIKKKTNAQVIQDIKDEVQEFIPEKDKETGKVKKVPKYKNWQIKRLVRTEYASARVISQLLKWREQGFTHVRHKTRFSKNTGKKDAELNGKVFSIDYLLSARAGYKYNGDRIPVHP